MANTGAIWSGRPDLNRRPPAPKAGALPGCATPRHETALFILKHFPTLLLIRVVIFGLTVPKLCQILLLNRSCARFQRHLVGLTVHFLQGLSLHLQFHLRILFEDLCVALSKELCNPLVGDTACTESSCIGGP